MYQSSNSTLPAFVFTFYTLYKSSLSPNLILYKAGKGISIHDVQYQSVTDNIWSVK